MSLGYIFQDNALQQDNSSLQKNQMHLHGRIFRTNTLTFVAQKLHIAGCKNLRSFRGHGGISRNQDPLRILGTV